jgi:hypothetical protein
MIASLVIARLQFANGDRQRVMLAATSAPKAVELLDPENGRRQHFVLQKDGAYHEVP